MNVMNRSITPWTIRQRVRELRKRFGTHDWLTVVGGVTAEAYRLAGFDEAGFAELLRSETARRGRLLIHLRKRACMQLRSGFDGQSGGVFVEDGFAHLHLHFSAGHYTDAENRPMLRTSAKLRTSLILAGGLNRPVGQLGLENLPRCLRAGGGRIDSISHERTDWGCSTTLVATRRIETLGTMPVEVARELGLDEQRGLGDIPWLGMRSEPARPLREPHPVPAEPTARKRPALRLVAD